MAQDLPDNAPDFIDAFQGILRFQPLSCDWIERAGRQTDLEALGITRKQAEEVLRDTLAETHLHGPIQPDDHAPDHGKIAVFRYPIDPPAHAYIKIGLRLTKSRTGQLRAVIWSFKPWT